MRDLMVSEFVTLDGVMEAPGGEPSHPHSGWVGDFMGPEQEQYKLEEVLDAEVLLIGRVTYESFAGAWPSYEGPFADKMNGMPKFVVLPRSEAENHLHAPRHDDLPVGRERPDVRGHESLRRRGP